ncbi:Zn(2)-C6 fungal-type domain-containing protein [Fusarium keratoplasticum]|uniref:Zn(2)-C6 fungal-type domain-containing protein n=1 Tax=Fusarium keratoplasticum TaxID=1328300 RepID=A0ACC0QCW7_9HYPO|nr:Zn(2)-C6 fungal-type domain-containing protein [Fusarium keratoplasticum]KAI8649073.1 Zn(2)-C6 fungal-type domain-containing protein [Fusarium keratoplasticum]
MDVSVLCRQPSDDCPALHPLDWQSGVPTLISLESLQHPYVVESRQVPSGIMRPHSTESDLSATPVALGKEPLSCLSCRARKLKCNRAKPACSRCSHLFTDCAYPESRKKPIRKRRTVKELEARLVEVERYMKKGDKRIDGRAHQGDRFHRSIITDSRTSTLGFNDNTSEAGQKPLDSPTQAISPDITEPLPPHEIIDDLNMAFFTTYYPSMPIVHPRRYTQAINSEPSAKPPMWLQYAIWATAAIGHNKYNKYHESFYRRARQCLEVDEMKSCYEQFVTIQHVQAWTLIALYETKTMIFTRSIMSAARSVRLCQMMGLDRIDGDPHVLSYSLSPPLTWTELEERRRAFWGAFSIDAYARISTGCPSLIDINDVAVRLPASENAFMLDQKEEAPFLHEGIKGAEYSGFAGTVIACQIFKSILRHIHRAEPSERADDIINDPFWVRHRELDDILSKNFIFLPNNLGMPLNTNDPAVACTHLDLRASIICLHHAAVEKCEKHGLPDSIKQTSIARLQTTAQEVVNIVRLVSHAVSLFKNPLCALALYLATRVYVYMAKQNLKSGLASSDLSNLGFIISAMEAMSRTHELTRAFLQQACADIEHCGLHLHIQVPCLKECLDAFNLAGAPIPIIARSSVAQHTEARPLVPSYRRKRPTYMAPGNGSACYLEDEAGGSNDQTDSTTHKQGRTSAIPESEGMKCHNTTAPVSCRLDVNTGANALAKATWQPSDRSPSTHLQEGMSAPISQSTGVGCLLAPNLSETMVRNPVPVSEADLLEILDWNVD